MGPQPDAEDWTARAACRGKLRVFFAKDVRTQRIAVSICRGCPVRRECEAEARAAEPRYNRSGVVAGFTPKERRAWD